MRKWLLILFLLQYKINITAQVSSTGFNNIDSFKVQLAKQASLANALSGRTQRGLQQVVGQNINIAHSQPSKQVHR